MAYPVAKNMIEVDELIYNGKNLAVIMDSEWITLSKERFPGTPFAFDLKVRPVMTFLKYLRSIHLPEGLSTTTSVSKTVGHSDTVSVDASVSTTVSVGTALGFRGPCGDFTRTLCGTRARRPWSVDGSP